MGTRTMSAETKAKIAATRAANKAAGVVGQKRASLEDQLAAIQAQADAGDAAAVAIMPVIDVYKSQLEQATKAKKTVAKKLRKLLSTLKD